MRIVKCVFSFIKLLVIILRSKTFDFYCKYTSTIILKQEQIFIDKNNKKILRNYLLLYEIKKSKYLYEQYKI